MPAIVANKKEQGDRLMKRKCVIYARVSSREQKEHGYSTVGHSAEQNLTKCQDL